MPQRREPELTGIALGAAVLDAEDARAPTPRHLATLMDGARSASPRVRIAAIRALGRLERRDIVSALLPYIGVDDADVRAEAADAIAQAMRGAPLQLDTGGQQVEGMLTALAGMTTVEEHASVLPSIGSGLARLPYERPAQVARAEAILSAMLALSKTLAVRIRNQDEAAQVMGAGAAGLELLARTQRTLFQPSESTITLLRAVASGASPTGGSEAARRTRRAAFSALIAAQGLDDDTLRSNLTYDADPQVRRLAMRVVGGASSPIAGAERADYIRRGLRDRSPHVRFEAVRAFAAHQARTDGCVELSQMIPDANEHVALAAIDALGDSCSGEDDTPDRLAADAGTPPETGSWRRESHALAALARRSPSKLEIPLTAHSRHSRWQVRMYAALAAAAADDVDVLERLALDENDNVREATLAPLKRLKKDGAAPQFLAALGRNDYQLLRTAARELAGLTPTRSMTDALADALLRITATRRETSRDTRIALLERLAEFGSSRYVEAVRALLRDFDPKVASAAAATMTAWTGDPFSIDPQPLPRQTLPSASELTTVREFVAVLTLDSGNEITISLDPSVAPVTSVRFLRLANANYFDGLTFHRIVPNFIVQGGSPGANEYMGDGPYLRDEISTRTHARGTIGLSTRGRDTGDAQFFINLVDNPRLDFEYTVFGQVTSGSMDRIDDIQEGDRIVDVKMVRARR